MNTKNKSVAQLENIDFSGSDFNSYVVKKSTEAVKKPIEKLSGEEIRLLIGQKIGLKYLIPIAIDIIEKNPLIEITFFEGDLLLELLRLSAEDWQNNNWDFIRFAKIVSENLETIKSCNEIPDKLIEKYIINICAECGSEYLKSSSEMSELCPQCASILYEYENCKHI